MVAWTFTVQDKDLESHKEGLKEKIKVMEFVITDEGYRDITTVIGDESHAEGCLEYHWAV